jgi:hypothetical protein
MAIALIPVLVWVGIAFWVLRNRRRTAEASQEHDSVAPPAVPITLDPVEMDWSATDDRALTRLLDQSAP